MVLQYSTHLLFLKVYAYIIFVYYKNVTYIE